ncbi:DUF2059 domain-containing protein [Sandaracinobacteroides saxicola]|uniref:DUF2059 domain-containing protein n=1 Tax=Sandaracinobacteroides saxicola TaxID=2759707 RepID=A0A7G5IFV2_9SPHN|nr:DUF2059 domain-containing protein [Sandaracinobacteroides saxicola]QMW22244.1 DUF2059 domain-containing protein [Sandaracinobacteroides saxicola]
MALGKRIAAAQLPDGTYEKMMSPAMQGMMGQVSGQAMDIPLRQIARMANLKPEQLRQVGPGSLRDMMAILDPAHDQRMSIMLKTMIAGMTPLMTKMEPRLRDGMAEAFASRFTETELREIDRFYSTPLGARLAVESTLLMADPSVVKAMSDFTPQLIQAMPGIMKQVEEATAKLPKAKRVDELSPAERARLAALIGVDPASLSKPERPDK